MASIYLSYRPGDNDAIAGRFYDHLVELFGRDAVIWRDTGDAGTLATPGHGPGLRDVVVVVALIGPRWLRGVAPGDAPPLTRVDDPVRLELEAAMARRQPIIPVLTQDAAMPQAPYLPPMLRPLAGLTPMPLRNDPDFRRDVDRLVAALERYVAPLAATGSVRRLSSSALALLAAVALLVISLSAAGVVFAARSGFGLLGGQASASPTATPIIHRTPTLVTAIHDPLTTEVFYAGGLLDSWAVNISECSFVASGYQVVGAPDAQHIALCYGPPSALGSDERLTVTTQLTTDGDPQGVYGMYFRSGDSSVSTGYEFSITPAGTWALVNVKTGRLFGASSRVIHTGSGAVNTLTVDAYGSLIILYVNGTRLGHISDSSFAAGQCGFFAEHGLTVVYTNFTLQRYQ